MIPFQSLSVFKERIFLDRINKICRIDIRKPI